MKLTMIKPCHLEQPTWKNSPDGPIYRYDVAIAKNYLNEKELKDLNRIVTMYLDYAELQAENHNAMTTKDWVEKLILVTTNKKHIAYSLIEKYNNLDILYYEELDLTKLLEDLFSKYHVERLTIQSGGSLNGLFLRGNLIYYVNIVIAPLLVGGKDVSTLIAGEAISHSE